MANDIVQQENKRLRERLQACESRARLANQRLSDFHAHLMTSGLSLPIATLAPLIDELAEIRALLAGEGGGQ